MGDFFEFLALGMSSIGIGVSLWAKHDSKRSADAAELSANEAIRASKLSKSQFLTPHFYEAEGLWRFLIDGKGFHENFTVIPALKILQSTCSFDIEMLDILELMEHRAKEFPTEEDDVVLGLGYPNATEEDVRLQSRFESKKIEYLNIG